MQSIPLWQGATPHANGPAAPDIPTLDICQDGGRGLGMKDGITWHEDCLRWLGRRLKSA
ncbi:MAG: hypothetical protein NTV93_05050 [Verrucomicrobia bacterium]|nr:hypothetical protein [Verrucomicrobiota bacterium]